MGVNIDYGFLGNGKVLVKKKYYFFLAKKINYNDINWNMRNCM